MELNYKNFNNYILPLRFEQLNALKVYIFPDGIVKNNQDINTATNCNEIENENQIATACYFWLSSNYLLKNNNQNYNNLDKFEKISLLKKFVLDKMLEKYKYNSKPNIKNGLEYLILRNSLKFLKFHKTTQQNEIEKLIKLISNFCIQNEKETK